MNHFIHRKATKKDVSLIVEINNKRTDRNDENGYVLNTYCELDVVKKIDDGHTFFLIYNKELCIGFLELSYKKDSRIPDELNWVNEKDQVYFKSSLLYIERICLLNLNESKGAGKYIYHKCLKENAYCFIVENPAVNKKSIDFHLKNGFKKVAQFNRNTYAGFDDYQCGLYLCLKL